MKRTSLMAAAGVLLLILCVSLFHVHRTGRMPHWCHYCLTPTIVKDRGTQGHCMVCGRVWNLTNIAAPFDWSEAHLALPLVNE